MVVDYNNFAKTFSKSRKNMKWEEIDFFLDFISNKEGLDLKGKSVLDVGCGNGRFHGFFSKKFTNFDYTGIDLSIELIKEAKELSLENNFFELDMKNIDSLNKQFDYIFFIASFHHLDNFLDRIDVLEKVRKLLKKDGMCFMTNWALNSDVNKKYNDSVIPDSLNEFSGLDYNIKIGEFYRYYHCFSLSELEYLYKKTGFEIIENKLYDTHKNYISIIK